MPIEEESSDEAPDGETPIPKSKFQGVVKDRDGWKSKYREIEAWKAEREAADEAAAHEKLKQEKQFEKLIGELQGKISTLTQERDGVQAEWQSKWDAREAAERADKFQSAIADKFPGVNRTILRALMRELAEGGGLDLAPEKQDGRTVDAAVANLKKNFPDVLTNRGNSAGGAPYVPMPSPQNRALGMEGDLETRRAKVRDMAKRHSEEWNPSK